MEDDNISESAQDSNDKFQKNDKVSILIDSSKKYY